MEDVEFQKKHLEAIYSAASRAPIFKKHAVYCINQYDGATPYIAYSDVMDYRFIIRATKNYKDKSDVNPIIVEYSSIDELVWDGWRLD
jgi:hypothetical protein